MTVYLIQQPRVAKDGWTPDLSSATQYGAIVPVFGSTEQPALLPVPSSRKARKLLQNFTDDDYLLWAGGDPLALGLCFYYAGEANRGRIKFLRWDRERSPDGQRERSRGSYMPVEIFLQGERNAA